MGDLFGTVNAFLQGDGWFVRAVPEESTIWARFMGDSGEWTCAALLHEAQNQFIFYSFLQDVVPADQRSRVAEFITRANYGMLIGNFEMDWGDGEIRFKTSIDVKDGDLTPALVRNVVYINVLTMDHYRPGFAQIIAGDADPVDVLSAIEGDA
jgi:hypothetical protein